MNRTLVATLRKKLLRRGRGLLRGARGQAPRPGDLGGLSDSQVFELREIHAALERIERGIFGRCEGCQGAIEEARLIEIPWEQQCAPCRGVQPAAEAPALAPEDRA